MIILSGWKGIIMGIAFFGVIALIIWLKISSTVHNHRKDGP